MATATATLTPTLTLTPVPTSSPTLAPTSTGTAIPLVAPSIHLDIACINPGAGGDVATATWLDPTMQALVIQNGAVRATIGNLETHLSAIIPDSAQPPLTFDPGVTYTIWTFSHTATAPSTTLTVPACGPSATPTITSTATVTSTVTLTPTFGPSPTSTATAVTSAGTIYAVTNPNPTDLLVEHSFSNGYLFFSRVPISQTVSYDVGTMVQIPHPFTGTVTLNAPLPFTAKVVRP